MELLKEINEQSQKDNLWWVFFVVQDSRLSGSHAVNAASKKEAKQIVQNADPRYKVEQILPLEQVASEDGETLEQFMDNHSIPKPGMSVELEMGT